MARIVVDLDVPVDQTPDSVCQVIWNVLESTGHHPSRYKVSLEERTQKVAVTMTGPSEWEGLSVGEISFGLLGILPVGVSVEVCGLEEEGLLAVG